MANRFITFQWRTSRYLVGRIDGVRLRIDVTATLGVDSNVFAYILQPLNPQTGAQAAAFDHVCSSADLAEFPVAAPRVATEPPWFRLPYVDVILRSWEECQAAIIGITTDLQMLKASLDAQDLLGAPLVMTIGEVPATPVTPVTPTYPEATSQSSSYGLAYEITGWGSFLQSIGTGVPWASLGKPPSGVDLSESADYAQVTLRSDEISAGLLIQGFEFSGIPHDAEISGYIADIVLSDLQAPSDTPGFTLSYLSLVDPIDGPVGEDRGSATLIQGAHVYRLVVGAEDDTWGAVITPEHVMRGEFGIMLMVNGNNTAPLTTVIVESVKLSLYYRLPQPVV